MGNEYDEPATTLPEPEPDPEVATVAAMYEADGTTDRADNSS